jgi:CheY-like chemotaxis protein
MSKRPLILVVEDDDAIREVVILSLEMEGYRVHSARNGEEALELLSAIDPPCLIILDLMMPEMDGWTFVKVVKQDRAIATIPIIVTSATPQYRQISGVDQILTKPVDLEGLIRLVDHYCRKKAS